MKTRLAPHVTALVIALVAGLALVTGSAPAQAAHPTYGAWSSELLGVSVRVAPPNKSVAKAYVQVRRSTSTEQSNQGDREVRISWKPKGKASHTSAVRSLAPGALVTLHTTSIGCGHKMTLTLSGRARASSSSAWSAWKSFNLSGDRSC